MKCFERFLVIRFLLTTILSNLCGPALYAGIPEAEIDPASASTQTDDDCKGKVKIPIDDEQLQALLTSPELQHEHFQDSEGSFIKILDRTGCILLGTIAFAGGMTCLAGACVSAAGAIMLVFHEAWDLGPKIFLSTTFGGAGVAALGACVCGGAVAAIKIWKESRRGSANETTE